MILAYHSVPKESFQEVIETGYIVPAVDRLGAWILRNRAKDMLDSFYASMSGETIDPMAERALGHLIDARFDYFEESQPEESQSEFTYLNFVDILAFDGESVFLQVGGWPSWVSSKPTGFIFGAEELVERGATFRKKDLGPAYWARLQNVVGRKFGNVDQAERAILKMFSDVQRENQLTGKAALKAVKGKHGSQPPELLWHDRLPISLAIDWIYEGETVRV